MSECVFNTLHFGYGNKEPWHLKTERARVKFLFTGALCSFQSFRDAGRQSLISPSARGWETVLWHTLALNVTSGSKTYHIHSCFINQSESCGHTLISECKNIHCILYIQERAGITVNIYDSCHALFYAYCKIQCCCRISTNVISGT